MQKKISSPCSGTPAEAATSAAIVNCPTGQIGPISPISPISPIRLIRPISPIGPIWPAQPLKSLMTLHPIPIFLLPLHH